MNKHFSLKQGLLGKTAKRCSSPLVRGFTLIELLIYTSVFVIAAGLLTPGFSYHQNYNLFSARFS